MPVENTISPIVSPTAPNDSPRNTRPSSSTRIASVVLTLLSFRQAQGPMCRGSYGRTFHEGAVTDGRSASQEGRDDLTGQAEPGVRVVARQRRRVACVDDAGRSRVDEHDV